MTADAVDLLAWATSRPRDPWDRRLSLPLKNGRVARARVLGATPEHLLTDRGRLAVELLALDEKDLDL